jgi:hypothetical protein
MISLVKKTKDAKVIFYHGLFNLEALFRLAVLGDYVGVDCWNITAKNGGSLYAALDYLAPYTDPHNPWPVNEVSPADRKLLLPLLAQPYAQNKDAKYKAQLEKFYGDGPDDWRLFWPYDRQRPIKTAYPLPAIAQKAKEGS